MKRLFFFVTVALSLVILAAITSWAVSTYSYQCEIVRIAHDSGGYIVHVMPGLKEKKFSDEARVFIGNDQNSEALRNMVLSAASGGKEILISTTAQISWSPQTVEDVTIIVSEDGSDEQRDVYHGPLTLTSYSVDNNGSYYYIKDPSNLPENAVAVRVPNHKATLAAFMTNAYMNSKLVSVAISHRWWLGADKLAWTIYAAKLDD